MNIGNRLREIRKSVNKKSQMSLRDVLVFAQTISYAGHVLPKHANGVVVAANYS